jgi:hypothetical protein
MRGARHEDAPGGTRLHRQAKILPGDGLAPDKAHGPDRTEFCSRRLVQGMGMNKCFVRVHLVHGAQCTPTTSQFWQRYIYGQMGLTHWAGQGLADFGRPKNGGFFFITARQGLVPRVVLGPPPRRVKRLGVAYLIVGPTQARWPIVYKATPPFETSLLHFPDDCIQA